MLHTRSSNAAMVRRSLSVQVGVALVTARTSASRRRWSTSTNSGSPSVLIASRAANDPRDENTRAVISGSVSSSRSSYATPASSSRRAITASCRCRSVGKWRYTVRSPTPARSATARKVSASHSQESYSCTSSEPAVTIRWRVAAACCRRTGLSYRRRSGSRVPASLVDVSLVDVSLVDGLLTMVTSYCRQLRRMLGGHHMVTHRELMEAAVAETGLDDFGHQSFLEGLEILVDALGAEARLNPAGEAFIY